MSHGVDSLNVAAASAVAFWELGKSERNLLTHMLPGAVSANQSDHSETLTNAHTEESAFRGTVRIRH